MSKIEDFLSGARDTPIYWPGQIKRILDDYNTRKADYIHGNQKDAIQNMVDAVNPKSKDKTKFAIRLLEDTNIPLLILEDYGTTGLTGRVLESHEMNDFLAEEERWARFESLSFSKTQVSQTLGARGQGKFMLLAASADVKITPSGVEVDENAPPWLYYDTLRDDGVYRYGKRIVMPTTSKVKGWDNSEGKAELGDDLGIDPINHVGSRIIIPNPKDGIIKAIKDGTYARYISVTWFPLLCKNSDLVYLEYDGKEHVVLPDERLNEIPKKDDVNLKIWRRKSQITYANRDNYDVEIILAAEEPNDQTGLSENLEEFWANDDIRHVNIYRGGMHIMSVENRNIPQKIMNRIYGYVKLDGKLEGELRKVEDATHYHLDLEYGPGKKLKQFIEREILTFSREKLGYDEIESSEYDERDARIRRNVLNTLNELSRKLGLEGVSGPRPDPVGPCKKCGNDPCTCEPRQRPDIDIEVRRMAFPLVGVRRVNYDENIENIGCTVYNGSFNDVEGKIAIVAKINRKTIHIVHEENITVESGGKFVMDNMALKIDEDIFDSPGKYLMNYTFISSSKGHRKVSRTRPFWVEEDEPSTGIWKNINYLNFDGTGHGNKRAMAEQTETRNWNLNINTSHPGYMNWASGAEADEEDYVLQVSLPWFVFVDIVENEPDERQFVEYDIDEQTFMKLQDTMGLIEKTSWL